jgi:hypothetical protein
MRQIPCGVITHLDRNALLPKQSNRGQTLTPICTLKKQLASTRERIVHRKPNNEKREALPENCFVGVT